MKYRLLGAPESRFPSFASARCPSAAMPIPGVGAHVSRLRDAGINFFDTADQYNKGRSEEILGELMRGERDLVIATKCFNPTGADINARGSSRRHVSRALEASLKRLGTDRIEILYLHHYDALTPLEEQMRALEDLVRAGKVLYPAVSNFAAWQTQAARCPGARRLGAAGNAADVQPGEAPG